MKTAKYCVFASILQSHPVFLMMLVLETWQFKKARLPGFSARPKATRPPAFSGRGRMTGHFQEQKKVIITARRIVFRVPNDYWHSITSTIVATNLFGVNIGCFLPLLCSETRDMGLLKYWALLMVRLKVALWHTTLWNGRVIYIHFLFFPS